MTDLLTALNVPDRTNIPRDEHGRPRVLIEEWLPIKELGIESVRESAPIPGQFPKIKTLHVWWARRPLAASAGTILCSVLPIWSKELAEAFDDPRLADEETYRKWVLWLCGIWGDPVAAKTKSLANKAAGIKTTENPYTYKPAFKNRPNPSDLMLLHRLVVWVWGDLPAVLDPTAGGGSIPYTAARYGLPTHANDLNSVAAAALRAGVEATATAGASVLSNLQLYGDVLVARCIERTAQFFPTTEGEEVTNYVFARTVACPRTGKHTPLAPNWWIAKSAGLAQSKWTAVRPVTERLGDSLAEVEFELIAGQDAIDSRPDDGTQARGTGVSVWDGLPIDSDYIKAEAQAGRMDSVLYAVATRISVPGSTRKQRLYRPPTSLDREAIQAAAITVEKLLQGWVATGVVPAEEVPDGNDGRPKNYGMLHWRDMFSPRQLLVHGVFVEEWLRLRPAIDEDLGPSEGRTVSALLGLIQGKALNWNGLMSSWDSGRTKVRSVFDRHDLAFKWTYAEFEGSKELFPWCLSQVIDSFRGIAELYAPGDERTILPGGLYFEPGAPEDLATRVPGQVAVTRGTAASLPIESGSQSFCCIDPPYYDNVMYAELSDYFGVWEQHTIGRVWPDLMPGGLADTASEAVANVARFAHTGKRKKELATLDYEAKMQAIFAEAHRVLSDDGVLTVMFTHKKAEAWDTLGMALMEAGFQIETSWPVNTESEQSLHIAKKNAAASTIMLVCRKRPAGSTGGVFFDDLVPDIRQAARTAVKEFASAGINGVDLLLSSYGPVLSVISEHWPVLSSEADESGNARRLRPEEALDIAREELLAAERRALVGKDIQFDPPTDFVLFAWNTFKAAEFPYDDARKLAVACAGSDIDDLVKGGVASKKTGTVTLRSPKERMKQTVEVKTLDPKAGTMIDQLWGILAIAESSGLTAAKAAMDRAGISSDQKFSSLVQAAVNAVPRTKKKGEFTRPEAEWLDKLASTYFAGSVELPEDPDSGRLFDVD